MVCKEFEQVLLDAWREEEEQAEKRKAEVYEKDLKTLTGLDRPTRLPCWFCSPVRTVHAHCLF